MLETRLATGWEFCRLGSEAWLPARVPGHVHDDLLRHGLIADPFYRMNERECQWVDEEDWTYRCRFPWSAKPGCPKRVLRFEGLDTVCDVFLNGEKVASHDNMFLPLEVDVSPLLRPENELVVSFSSAVRIAEDRKAQYLAQEEIDRSVTTFYERSFVRKAQYMFGWDWGPRLVSCGVWKMASLLEFDSRVTDVWIRPKRQKDGLWEVNVSWAGERIDAPKLSLWRSGGTPSFDISGCQARFEMRDPGLWSPNDMGPPVQHTLCLDFGGVALNRRFGCRTVELVRERDEWGESLEFVVNDRPVFCRGANWIPDHSFPSLCQESASLSLAALGWPLKGNMVRVWGGGLYGSDAFYDWCDETGTMVWQDFPFACAYYPEDDAFLTSVEAEAQVNVRRLRNHPSLVLWCGNNECQQMHQQRWGGEASPSHCYGERIYDDVLPRVLAEEDPDRPYVHGSPSGKVPGRDCNMDGVGDSHYWEVWHGKGDWRHYEESTSRFSSEFGFASSPSLFAWSRCLDHAQDWTFDSEAVRWHDKTLKGYEKYISFVEAHYPKIGTIEDLVYFSQLNQRDAMRCALEHYVRAEFCRGTLIWQLNDCWPVQSWSLMDSERRMKSAAEEVARLFSPVVTSMRAEGETVDCWVTNNGYDPFDLADVAALGIYSTDGHALQRVEASRCRIDPGHSAHVVRLELGDWDPRRHFALFSLHGGDINVRFFVEPKDIVTSLSPIIAHVCGPNMLRLSCDTPVFDLWVYDPDDLGNVSAVTAETVRLVMPGFPFLRVVRFEREPERLVARSLAGYHDVEITRTPL